MASHEGLFADEIVRAALTRPVQERAAYLAAACAGNDRLLGEAHRLLHYYENPTAHSGSLLKSPSKKRQQPDALSHSQQIPSALKGPASPSALNAPTVRAEEMGLPEALRQVISAAAEPASPPLPAAPSAESLDPSGTLGWLARLTDDLAVPPAPTTSAPATNVAPASHHSATPPYTSPPTSSENPERGDLFVSPTVRREQSKKTFDHGSPFEQLFKRVTLSSHPTEPAAPPSPPLSSSGTEILPPHEPYQTTITPTSDATNYTPPAAAVGGMPFTPTNAQAFAQPSQVMEGFTTSARTLDGRMLGTYQLLYEIGRGGMGRVYLAEDKRLGRRIALKLLLRSSTRNPERVRRFEQEARAASSLNHPNILTIHEIGEIKGVHYLATEFVEGFTLRQLIENRALTLIKIIDVAIQIADALATAHDANIVHRDIKPENLMMRLDGYVKVLDFGVAKLIERNPPSAELPSTQPFDTQPGTVIGTADYMSPEQARGLRVDHRTDIFSLGIILYEMVTGVRPFVGVTATDVVAALLTREPIPITQRLSGAPEALHRILKRALQKEREQRYGSARELAHDLKLLKQDLELTVRTNARGVTGRQPAPNPSARASRPMAPPAARPSVNPAAHQPPPNVARPRPSQRPAAPPAATGALPHPNVFAPAPPAASQAWRQQPTTFSGVVRVPDHHASSTAARPIVQPTRTGSLWLGMAALLIGAVLLAVFWIAFFRPPENQVMAIMPFVAQHLSGGDATLPPEDEEVLRLALAENLHEALWQRLGPLPKLQVVARNSVRNLRKGLPAREIAEALNARYVLSGRLLLRGPAVTVSLELFDGETGKSHWSQRYERALGDLHTLPEALSAGVAEALELQLNAVQTARLTRRETNKSEAFTDYLKGRYLWQQRQPEALKSSLNYLRHATELDANFARAYAAMAESYALAPLFNLMSPLEAAQAARSSAAKALILDAQIAEAHRAQGIVAHQYEWNFPAAEKSYLRALEINPNYGLARQELGSLLTCLGRHEEGLRAAQTARVLDPLSSASQTNVSAAYYFAARYQQTIDDCLGTTEFNPKAAGAFKYLGLAYQQMSRMPDALEALQKAASLEPHNLELRAQLACVEADAGKSAEAQARLAELRKQAIPQYRMATLYAALGDKEQAIVALTQAVANHEPGVVWLKVDPQMNLLRNDQRFKELLKQIGLP